MVNLQEWHLQLQLMQQDERQREEREARRLKAKANRAVFCLLAAFWLAVGAWVLI